GGIGQDQAAIVGHDIGGGVAQLLSTTGLVKTLVLVDTVAFDRWPTAGLRTLQATPPERQTKEVVERHVRLAFEVGTARTGLLSPADVDVYLAPWLADPPALFRAAAGMDGEGLRGVDANVAAHG